MSIAQKIKQSWLGMAKSRWLIGRRVVLSFRNAENPQVLIFRVPDAELTSFFAQEETDAGRVWFALKMAANGDATTLARFQSKDEALIALGKIRGMVAGGLRRPLKWIALLVAALFLLNWIGGLLVGGGSSASEIAQAYQAPLAPMPSAESDAMLREMLRAAQQNPLGPAGAGPQPEASPQAASQEPPASKSGADSMVEALKNAQ